MKKTTFVIFLLSAIFFTKESFSQLSLNFESGNKAIEQGNCWVFTSVNYSNLEFRIAGFWSGRSIQLTSSSPATSWIKTPWITPASGNITMKVRLENDGGTMRGVVFSYIPYDAASPSASKEGATTIFSTYYFPTPLNIWIKDLSIPVPAVVANSQQPHKIVISFIGTGGTSRMFSDDIVIPGTYNSNPAGSCLPLVTIADADNDGVADANDAYPNDPVRAYNAWFPSAVQMATLGFEDLWPSKGDFDFNDVVVDYRLQVVTNADNKVVETFGKFDLKASGASFHNGFGFQLDNINPDKIISVSGNSVQPGTVYTFASNGLEAGQSYANCIVFGDFYKVMSWPGSGQGINTDPSSPFVPYVTLNVKLAFINDAGQPAPGGTLDGNLLTPDVFNFYIVTNQTRGREIHLADRMPTDLADETLLGTEDDDSGPNGTGYKYYKTDNNLPWAIQVVEGFAYPTEKSPVNEAYLNFVNWAASNGTTNMEWFSDNPGNRNAAKIYQP